MIVWILIALGAAAALACAAFYFLQDRLVFYPTREFAVTPDQLNLPFEDVFIHVTPRDRIHGWYFRAPTRAMHGRTPVVLFCHGNAGNISHRLETVDLVLRLGGDIFVFDYRGYGRSDGSASEDRVYADAEACYHWLVGQKGIIPEDIILFGRSLGGAVAVEVARRVCCGGLIVESTFTSVADMARKIFPYFPVRYLLKYEFDSLRKIGSVTCPILVTHSPEDELVPSEMGERLFAAANAPKQFVHLRGGHNDRDFFEDAPYKEALRAFLHGS
ncbi:MAG TPA: alpha/beta hydrolase [Candidatus Deferrimicrobium sp.]|nr:alpha/beta hydrolase [Candidatus Deferrimicrobium sp.]